MTHYIDYIRALKSGVIINDYNHNPKLARLQSVRHIECYPVRVAFGVMALEYRYQSPVVTVTDAPPLAVVEKPLLARVRLPDKIRYKDGKRIVTEQWSGRAYPVTGVQQGFVLMDTGHGIIGRRPENVRYVETGVQIAEAA